VFVDYGRIHLSSIAIDELLIEDESSLELGFVRVCRGSRIDLNARTATELQPILSVLGEKRDSVSRMIGSHGVFLFKNTIPNPKFTFGAFE